MFGALVAVGIVFFSDYVGETMAIVSGDVLVDRIELARVFRALTFQKCQGGLEYLAARGFLLDIGSCLVSNTEQSNQPGKGQSLQDQGHENYSEGEKDDQVALRERAAIRQGLGQRDGSGERASLPAFPSNPASQCPSRLDK